MASVAERRERPIPLVRKADLERFGAYTVYCRECVHQGDKAKHHEKNVTYCMIYRLMFGTLIQRTCPKFERA